MPRKPPSCSAAPNINALRLRAGLNKGVHPLLSVEEREQLAFIASIRHFPAGGVLFHEGDEAREIFILVSGTVKVSRMSGEGNEVVLSFFFPNDLLGLLENGRYVNSAKALTPVTAYSLPLTALEHLLRTNPDLQLQFLAKLSHELREAQQHAITLSRFSARAKILMFLQLLKMHNAAPDSPKNRIHLPMTRLDIADYTGLTVETVSRNFTRLQREGMIRLNSPHCLEILDPKLLREILPD
ncbi:MAG TPA: Crp/Fnr family transcriptional regulator [Acidocella sp.]|nr:Crp/Fnr family transcriptional regulator [Acidocella sp.]